MSMAGKFSPLQIGDGAIIEEPVDGQPPQDEGAPDPAATTIIYQEVRHDPTRTSAPPGRRFMDAPG
jgi:hypothetical protein